MEPELLAGMQPLIGNCRLIYPVFIVHPLTIPCIEAHIPIFNKPGMAPRAAATPSLPTASGAKRRYDLSTLKWQLSGYMPYMERGTATSISDIHQTKAQKVGPIPASVPGSVQLALLNAGLIKDWNVGLNARDCQWVENEDWVYQTAIPDQWLHSGKQFRLHCEGLDYRGGIFLNGTLVANFEGSFAPHDFDLGPHLKARGNVLEVLFEPPPRWLGDLGYASRMKALKPRFNYGWDWISRMVQAGVWDAITLEVIETAEIREFRAVADVDMKSGRGVLKIFGAAGGGSNLRLTLADKAGVVHQQVMEPQLLARNGVAWKNLPVELWWPNGHGEQRLYSLTCELRYWRYRGTHHGPSIL